MNASGARTRQWWSLVVVLSLAACGRDAVSTDGGAEEDAGLVTDAGAAGDGGAVEDGGASDPDAGPDDAGAALDGGGAPDAGDADGGEALDAGPLDAGLLFLVSTTPVDGGLLQGAAVATFSLPLDAPSVTPGSVRLVYRGTAVPATLTQPGLDAVSLLPPLVPLRSALDWELTGALTSGAEVFAGARLAVRTPDGQWNSAGRLVTTNADTEPQLAAGGPNRHYAVWLSNNAVVRAGHLAPTALQRNRWEDDGILSTSSAVPSAPAFAVSRADVGVAAWLETNGSQRSVVASRLRRDDPTLDPAWSGPDLVQGNAPGAEAPQVGVDDAGNRFVVWTQLDGTRVNVFASRSAAPNGPWSTPLTLEPGTGAVANARLAVSANGTAVVAYVHDDTNAVRVVTYEPTTGWRQPQALEVNVDGAPAVAMNAAGEAVVAWAANGAIRVSEYASPQWSMPATVGAGVAPVAALTTSGRAAVLFVLQGNSTQVWGALRSGGTWTSTRLTQGNAQGVGFLLRLVASDEHLAAAWQQSTGIVVRRSPGDVGGWAQASTVIPAGTRPSLASDAWGLLTVAGQSGAPTQLFFNGFW